MTRSVNSSTSLRDAACPCNLSSVASCVSHDIWNELGDVHRSHQSVLWADSFRSDGWFEMNPPSGVASSTGVAYLRVGGVETRNALVRQLVNILRSARRDQVWIPRSRIFFDISDNRWNEARPGFREAMLAIGTASNESSVLYVDDVERLSRWPRDLVRCYSVAHTVGNQIRTTVELRTISVAAQLIGELASGCCQSGIAQAIALQGLRT